MKSKTRYEETPASELPERIEGPDSDTFHLIMKDGRKEIGYYSHLYKKWYSLIVDENDPTMGKEIEPAFYIKPSEPQAVSKSLEEAAEDYAKNIYPDPRIDKQIPQGKHMVLNPKWLRQREEIEMYRRIFIEGFMKAIEFSQQQQQENPICKWCGKYKRTSDGIITQLCECPQQQQQGQPSKSLDELADEIQGVMYKYSTDESDEGKWIEHQDYYKIATLIAEKLQPTQGNEVREWNENKISELACNIIRNFYHEDSMLSDSKLIEKHKDEWGWFMEGAKRYHNHITRYYKHTTTSKEEGK